MSTPLPLDGVRILAVEQYGAGPFGTMFLADQGAEVIKIENPNTGGDFAREVGPYFFTPDDSEFFHAYNRNKKSLSLDLSKPEGKAVFHDLVKGADAVASNLRGDVIWAARTEYLLREQDGDLRMARKKVMLVNNDKPLYTLSFLI